MNFCKNAGYLVGPEGSWPRDDVECYHGYEVCIVGCSNLVCETCQERVVVELVATPGGGGYRHYSCGCSRTTMRGRDLRDLADPHPEPHPWLPWACAGHPVVSLPTTLDDICIEGEQDVETLVRRTLAGWSPETARPPERSDPVGWMLKLNARLAGSSLEAIPGMTAANCLVEPDSRIRAAALEFFARCPWAPGAERVEGLARTDLESFAAVRDPLGKGEPLSDALLRALGRRVQLRDNEGVPIAPKALDVAREVSLRPGRHEEIYLFLGEADPSWLLAHVEEIARANPEGVEEIFNVFEGNEDMEAIARRLASVPGIEEKKVRVLARKYGQGGHGKRPLSGRRKHPCG